MDEGVFGGVVVLNYMYRFLHAYGDRSLAILFVMVASLPALASGTIGYGSRAGMEVTVLGVEGLNTARAIIRTKHTRENAISFCRDYVGKITEDCVRQELALPMNDQITANCLTGEFTDFFGVRYRFLGRNRQQDSMAKYAIVDLSTGEIADGSSASGYGTNMVIYRALCRVQAPSDQ